MQEAMEKLRTLLEVVPARLAKFTETESVIRPASGRWSKKEILGHLIDSAANNHQRFVRAQAEPEFSFPGYAQEFWVDTQQYQQEPWQTLIGLWEGYNTHLLHVITLVPRERLKHRCNIGGAEPVTLEFLVTDYVAHLLHHLEQIFGELPAA